MIATLFNQRPIYAWDVTFSEVPFHDLLSMAIYGTIVVVFANALHVVAKKLDTQTH